VCSDTAATNASMPAVVQLLVPRLLLEQLSAAW
jgi:hypothetical protein